MAIIGLVIIFQISGFWQQMHDTFRNRINSDLVPDSIRNTIYSLIPSLITLFGIPFIVIGGWVINEYGFNSGLVFAIAISGIGSVVTGIGLPLLSRSDLSVN